jgi:excisionase family DNA binding protein
MVTAIAAEPVFVRPHDVARILKVHRVTVYRWIESGQLPARKIGNVVFVSLDDLEAALQPVVDETQSRTMIELLAFELRHDADRRAALCPSCAQHPILESSPYGWCSECTNDKQIEADAAHEREKARQRRWWDANGKKWRQGRKPKESTDA